MTAKPRSEELKIMSWNVNNVTNDNDLIRDTVQKINPDLLILNETIEIVDNKAHLGLKDRIIYNINPVPKKGPKGGTRAGIDLVIKKEVEHHVNHVTRVEQETAHNGLIQAITLQLKSAVLTTGIYNSPATPAEQVFKTLDELMSTEGEGHLIMGDLNARNRHWDSERNKVANAAVAWQRDKHLRISAAQSPSYRTTNGNKPDKTSNIEKIVHIIHQDIEIETVHESENRRGSDHLPVTTTVNVKAKRRTTTPRIPKTMLRSGPATESSKHRYAVTMPMMAAEMR